MRDGEFRGHVITETYNTDGQLRETEIQTGLGPKQQRVTAHIEFRLSRLDGHLYVWQMKHHYPHGAVSPYHLLDEMGHHVLVVRKYLKSLGNRLRDNQYGTEEATDV